MLRPIKYWKKVSLYFIASFLMLLLPFISCAQKGTIQGKVYDAESGESLPLVNIVIDGESLVTSDNDGFYSSTLSSGKHTLVFKYVGYLEKTISINLKPDELTINDIYLTPKIIELNTAVISASRYEQRLSDVIVSMEVLPAKFIESVNTYYLDETISMLPGIDIIDGQANIRGGSGFTYGAGSRVQVLMDGLPILTGGVDDIKWNSLPTEIIGQVEVIKGASSALYGTSALNGVINLVTARPELRPTTTVEVSAGMYTKPQREEMAWFWDHNPLFGKLKFSHLQKKGQFDIALAASGLIDEGYRQDNDMKYGRFYGGIRYYPQKIKGLSAGLNTSLHVQALTDFLIWQDADSGAYIQNPMAITPMHGYRFNIDPYIVYFDAGKARHSLRSRYYRVVNQFREDEDKNNNSDVNYLEYQYHKELLDKLNLSAGLAFTFTKGVTSLYGDHYGTTQALYAQFDYRVIKRLSASLGARWERYTLDKSETGSRPVFRTGINYQAAELTFIRTSWGQGYRYPSMAEKYTSTNLGSLNIFPNDSLKPETGWSAEIGLKQGFVFKHWNGYIDIAGFWIEYNNMIEFIFGVYNPPGEIPSIEYVGFKSVNTGKARIYGADVSLGSSVTPGAFIIDGFVGYTYVNPTDLSGDTSTIESGESKMLKYRYRHAVKGDITVRYQTFDAGVNVIYRSFMERIDAAFEENIFGQYIFPGLKEYRQENNKGAVVFSLRFGWQFTPSSRISLFLNNIFNEEYMGRPGDIQSPRNFSLQYLLQIK